MDEKYKNRIEENAKKLSEIIVFDQKFVGAMATKEMFPFQTLCQLFQGGQSDKIVNFIKMLTEQGERRSYIDFINCLISTGQKEAAQILYPRLTFGFNNINSEDHVDEGSNKNCQMVKLATFFKRPPEYNVYAMQSKLRGYALVISNIDFENAEMYPRRQGGEVDEANVSSLFKELGFEVQLCTNCTKAQMQQALNSFCKKQNENVDAAVVVIMSHGIEKGILGTDGLSISEKEIIRKFSNEKCEVLAHKPKLIVFQSCRGDDRDFGVISRFPPKKCSLTVGEEQIFSLEEDKVPTFTHMKICYATYSGFVAMLNLEYGAWFISTLVEVFSEHSSTSSLDKMLNKIAAKVSEFESDGMKQAVHYESIGWCKDLYFNPGIYLGPKL